MKAPKEIPENHPVKRHFRKLADRALTQSSLTDKDILYYLSDLLVDFMYVENLYRLRDENGERLEYLVDMLEHAGNAPRQRRKDYYKHIGDYSLFILGMFPENLTYGRRMLSHSYYADTGRRSYLVASELEYNSESTVVFKKLAEKFERCVLSLNWVREYTSDPFYQYMLRQFRIT
ncbi:MAG: hypothetical protein ACRD1R_03785 [Acidobacteriota bacterium]